MKYTIAAIFLFFSVLLQTSFFRLIDGVPLLPDMPLVVLFVLSYRLPHSGVLVLAALTGAMIDLFSAVNFGASVFAAIAAFSVCYFIREKFLIRKNFSNIILSSVALFICFYLFLFISNKFLSFFGGNNFTFNLFSKNMSAEFVLSAISAACLAYFLASKINYVNIRNYKRFFKISA